MREFLQMPAGRQRRQTTNSKSSASKLKKLNYSSKRSSKHRNQLPGDGILHVPELDLSAGNRFGPAALELYQKHQILLIRNTSNSEKRSSRAATSSSNWPSIDALVQLFGQVDKGSVDETWSIENKGSLDPAQLSRPTILSNKTLISSRSTSSATGEAWYVSWVLQNDIALTDRFLSLVPCPRGPSFLMDHWHAQHTTPIWLFLGRNLTPPSAQSSITGRVEHTDSVSHAGTWHFQLSGEKVWLVRPLIESSEWQGRAPRLLLPKPRLRSQNDSLGNKSKVIRTKQDRRLRLRIRCEPGDVLLINTRLWWHQTELPSTLGHRDGISLSYARDFQCPLTAVTAGMIKEDGKPSEEDSHMMNVEGLYASKDVRKGCVVLTENELPDCSLPRYLSSDNCAQYLFICS